MQKWRTEFVEESSAEEYQDALVEAKAVLAAAPEGTERELRMYLAKEYSFETITVKPGEIEPEDVKDLQRRLPLMRELAAGNLNQEQYHKRQREEMETAEFQDALTEARAIVAAAPNGTDQELRVYLAKEYSDATYKVTPAEMDPEVVAELRQQLPKMQELASGQLTPEKYFQRQHESGETMDDGGFLKFYLIFRTLNIFNIINIVLGIGAAFLTAKGWLPAAFGTMWISVSPVQRSKSPSSPGSNASAPRPALPPA